MKKGLAKISTAEFRNRDGGSGGLVWYRLRPLYHKGLEDEVRWAPFLMPCNTMSYVWATPTLWCMDV